VKTKVIFITGTDTGVGKTVATAAMAAAIGARLSPRGSPTSVAVYKPVQTGASPKDDGDIDLVRRLANPRSVTEGVRLQPPMAPVAAARRDDVTLPTLADHAERIEKLVHTHDHVLVEGSGGLLVHLDDRRGTISELAALLGPRAVVVIVARSGLGTLNHTELTLQSLRHRALPIAGLIIGSWPDEPDDIDLDNRQYLSSLGVPLLASIPENSAQLDPATFRAASPTWFLQLEGLVG
jgi:dethiobiotin synthetase